MSKPPPRNSASESVTTKTFSSAQTDLSDVQDAVFITQEQMSHSQNMILHIFILLKDQFYFLCSFSLTFFYYFSVDIFQTAFLVSSFSEHLRHILLHRGGIWVSPPPLLLPPLPFSFISVAWPVVKDGGSRWSSAAAAEGRPSGGTKAWQQGAAYDPSQTAL